jgi:hypothetical protein
MRALVQPCNSIWFHKLFTVWGVWSTSVNICRRYLSIKCPIILLAVYSEIVLNRENSCNIMSRSSDYTQVLDWLDSYTTRDYISQITITHRPVFSVTLLPPADVPLLPGSCLCRLVTISHQPHTLAADWRLFNCRHKTAMACLPCSSLATADFSC